jgi:hypothetical protein
MDQAALHRHSYREGERVAEAKDRELEELRRKLREAGIDSC